MLKDNKKQDNTNIDLIDYNHYEIELVEIPEIDLLESPEEAESHKEFIEKYSKLTPEEVAEDVETSYKRYIKSYKKNLEERTEKDKQLIKLLEESYNYCKDKKTKKQLGKLIKGFKNSVKEAEANLKLLNNNHLRK